MVDDSERLRIQLSALTHSPQGDVDDTRFEKLLDRLTPYVTEESKFKVFLDNEGLLSIEKGLSLDDERIVSIALRLVGFLASKLSNSSLLPNERVTKLMESLLDPQNININSDPLVRNACLIGLSTSLSSLISVDWVTSHERINRLVSFIFRSFSDSSVFIARSATQLLCELVTKGPNVENRLLEAGLKRHIDTSMSEVPKSDFNTIVSPPPLHHNKICLIDLAIALHQHSHSSILDISLSSLLGLLSDSDRHVRSRMVEAIQIISANNNHMELDNTNHSLAKLEKDIYDITNRLIRSGENDLILTAIELVGVLNVGISGIYLQKFLDLVIGIIVPAFEKVIPIRVEVANTFPVDIPQNILLQSVLECFKNMVSNGHTKILPGPLIVDLVKYGLTGPSQNQYAIYVRECRPAFELAALILSIFPSPSLPEPPSSLPWITQNEIQSILHTLLVSLARSWSSVSVKTVVSLLGNGKLESKIFVDFGFQLKESISKGFASDESESREHVVAFIGTLYKADTTPTAVQYYLTSGFYQIIITALSDSDSAVRTAALESLKHISAEERTWREMVSLAPEVIVPLVSSFKPSESVANSNSSDLAEYKLLQLVVHLLYDEDPYVQRESIAVIRSWTTPEHTKLALQYLIWKSTSGLHEGINHALHRSDWDAQVQAIQLLRSISFSLGFLSFFAIRGHSLVLDMIKNCEERVSQKEAYKTLRDLREFIDQNNSDPSLLLTISLPLPLSVPVVGSAEYFQEELKELISQIRTLEVDKMLQGLSDEHLYDEDEEEDLVLKYQDITSHDDLDCD